MNIQVKLMGTLRKKSPPGATSLGVAPLEIEPGTSISAVLDQLGLRSGNIHLVLVNGTMERDKARPLAEGDELVVFPPVAGG